MLEKPIRSAGAWGKLRHKHEVSMDPEQLRDLIIIPALQHLQEYNTAMLSEAAVNLLLCTAAHESHCGEYLKQTDGGPALGIYQVEPETHDSLWTDWLTYEPKLLGVMSDLQQSGDPHQQLVYDLRYSTVIARAIYWFSSADPLPAANDLESIADYWDEHYNANGKPHTVDGFLPDIDRVRGALL